MIIEVFGGITPHALAHIGHLSRRTKGKGARDYTKYGASRTSTKYFFVHHTQRIAFAAQHYDAMAIRKETGSRKQRPQAACAATLTVLLEGAVANKFGVWVKSDIKARQCEHSSHTR